MFTPGPVSVAVLGIIVIDTSSRLKPQLGRRRPASNIPIATILRELAYLLMTSPSFPTVRKGKSSGKGRRNQPSIVSYLRYSTYDVESSHAPPTSLAATPVAPNPPSGNSQLTARSVLRYVRSNPKPCRTFASVDRGTDPLTDRSSLYRLLL